MPKLPMTEKKPAEGPVAANIMYNNNNNNIDKGMADNKENLPIPHKHNSKALCASPPAVLKDKKATVSFTKGKLLGEGGFARCYEVWDGSGKRFAAKSIAKASLKSPKSKQKLFTEIKIHQNMRHPHIVQFQHVFEDSQNVYIILELCENRTFVEMMKRKKRMSESEASFYAKQILDAISYMHKKNVIHRDLKLGNLFLNSHNDIKIGDFGLATVVANENERKKTICGTPNYIAPEILFDRKNGHSFEVDLWSFGDYKYQFRYTMLIGRPPFQTKDVQEIYRKIRDNDYEFPKSVAISPQAKNLIQSLLCPTPDLRPKIEEIQAHSWFQTNMPKELAPSVLLTPPKFINQQIKAQVESNFKPVLMETKKVLTPKLIPDKNNEQKPPYPTPEKRPVSTSTPKQVINDPTKVQISPLLPAPSRKSMLEKIYQNLKTGLSQAKMGNISSVLFKVSSDVVVNPKIFISKWIDYSNKYGLGYQLTNGSVGVYFNDSTSIIMAANDANFEYLEYAKGSDKTVMNRQAHLMSKYPDTLMKKVTLIKYFKTYMQDNLSKASQHCFVDNKTSNLDFLVKYMRTKHAVMFRLTNQIVQINFFDHTKLILSANGLVVTFINRDREMTTYSLVDVLKANKSEIISRLKYTRDILESLTVGTKAAVK